MESEKFTGYYQLLNPNAVPLGNDPINAIDPLGYYTITIGISGAGVVPGFGIWGDLEITIGGGGIGIGGHIGGGVGTGLGASLGLTGGWSPADLSTGKDPGFGAGIIAGIGPGFGIGGSWGPNGQFGGLSGSCKVGPTLGGGVFGGPQIGGNLVGNWPKPYNPPVKSKPIAPPGVVIGKNGGVFYE